MVEIVEISLPESMPAAFEGACIERPRPGDRFSTHVIEVQGWCLGGHSAVVAIELVDGEIVVSRGLIGLDSSDLAPRFPQNPSASTARFKVAAPITGMTPLSFQITAVLKNQARVSLATVRAERRWEDTLSSIGAPLVSVVVPCYNQSRFLDQAIESVLAQTYPHFEIVVVDDGSPDNAAEVASRYPGVTYVRQENRGVAAARNAGLRRSRGSYLVFLDADDRLHPDALKIGLSELASDPTVAFVSGQCARVEYDGTLRSLEAPHIVETDHYRELLRNCYIWTTAAVMLRRSVFASVGVFDPSFGPCADHDLFLRIALVCRVRCHGHVVAEYRRHATNVTRDMGVNLRDRMAVLRNQRRALGRGFRPHRHAYSAGVEFARGFFGEPLVAEVVSDVVTGEWVRAFQRYRTLVTCYPRGALSALLWLFRQRRGIRRDRDGRDSTFKGTDETESSVRLS